MSSIICGMLKYVQALYLYLMLIFLHVWPHMFTLMHSILLLTAFVTTLLYNGSVDSWVALTSDSKGHFQWPKGGLLSYTNWAPGEPLDNSGPHHNKTRVLTIFSHSHTFHDFVLYCVPLLRISLSPRRETVWRWFMETHKRTLACGLLELVRWKVMALSVKDNKVWCWLITNKNVQ